MASDYIRSASFRVPLLMIVISTTDNRLAVCYNPPTNPCNDRAFHAADAAVRRN